MELANATAVTKSSSDLRPTLTSLPASSFSAPKFVSFFEKYMVSMLSTVDMNLSGSGATLVEYNDPARRLE